MPVFADRHLREVDLDAAAGASRHLEGRGRQAGGAHVLDPDDGVRLEELEAGLHQELLGEGIADLHGRALLLRLVAGELLGGHRRAVDAVAAGLRARRRRRDCRRPSARPRKIRSFASEPDVHDVDEDVAVVRRVERRLAADRRDADAVAVARDAAHDAVHEVLHPRRVERAEAQRVRATRSAARPS